MFVAHLSGFSEAEEAAVKGASTTFLVFLYLLLSLLLFNLEVVHVLRSSLASFTYWMRASYAEAYPAAENGALPVAGIAMSSASLSSAPSSSLFSSFPSPSTPPSSPLSSSPSSSSSSTSSGTPFSSLYRFPSASASRHPIAASSLPPPFPSLGPSSPEYCRPSEPR